LFGFRPCKLPHDGLIEEASFIFNVAAESHGRRHDAAHSGIFPLNFKEAAALQGSQIFFVVVVRSIPRSSESPLTVGGVARSKGMGFSRGREIDDGHNVIEALISVCHFAQSAWSGAA
jgi:hypothetical protein